MDKVVNIYTDGSYSRKRKKGGYAVLFFEGKSEKSFKTIGYPTGESTNSRTELLAVITALEECSENEAWKHCVIHCDSQYVVKSYNIWMDSWRRKNWVKSNSRKVANVDLIKRMYDLKSGLKTNRIVEVVWVRGHNGDLRNEMADSVATTASR